MILAQYFNKSNSGATELFKGFLWRSYMICRVLAVHFEPNDSYIILDTIYKSMIHNLCGTILSINVLMNGSCHGRLIVSKLGAILRKNIGIPPRTGPHTPQKHPHQMVGLLTHLRVFPEKKKKHRKSRNNNMQYYVLWLLLLLLLLPR